MVHDRRILTLVADEKAWLAQSWPLPFFAARRAREPPPP
jgi:hypothetical protein